MKKLFFILLYYSGFGHLLMFINKRRNKVPVLVFHRVSPDVDNYWIPITPGQFESSIRFLSKEYDFVPLDDLFGKEKETLKHACVVVFDDTFKDFHTHALPVIKKYNVPVTMFAPVDCINKNEIIWTSQLDNCFKFTSKKELQLSINKEQLIFKFDSEFDKVKTAFQVQQILKTLPNDQRKEHLLRIKEILGYKNDPNISIMSWDDIIETRAFVNYQSHSMTHPVLSKIENDEALSYEIANSKISLEEKLNSKIDFFAYPMGDYSDAVLNVIKKHYKAGFAVKDKLVQLSKLTNTDYKYEIPRINVYHTNRFELFFRMNGFHSFFGK